MTVLFILLYLLLCPAPLEVFMLFHENDPAAVFGEEGVIDSEQKCKVESRRAIENKGLSQDIGSLF